MIKNNVSIFYVLCSLLFVATVYQNCSEVSPNSISSSSFGGNLIISYEFITKVRLNKNVTLVVDAQGGDGNYLYELSKNGDVFSEKRTTDFIIDSLSDNYLITVIDGSGNSKFINISFSSSDTDSRDDIEFVDGPDYLVQSEEIFVYEGQSESQVFNVNIKNGSLNFDDFLFYWQEREVFFDGSFPQWNSIYPNSQQIIVEPGFSGLKDFRPVAQSKNDATNVYYGTQKTFRNVTQVIELPVSYSLNTDHYKNLNSESKKAACKSPSVISGVFAVLENDSYKVTEIICSIVVSLDKEVITYDINEEDFYFTDTSFVKSTSCGQTEELKTRALVAVSENYLSCVGLSLNQDQYLNKKQSVIKELDSIGSYITCLKDEVVTSFEFDPSNLNLTLECSGLN